MPKYVLAYHGGGGVPGSEADQAALYERWGQWFGQLGEAVVDGGNPVSQARTVASDGSVTDGGGANPVSGYSIITAAGLDDAVAKVKGCPVLESGGSVEVAETIDM